MRHTEMASSRRTVLQHVARSIIPVVILAGGVGAMFALGKSDQGEGDGDDGAVAPKVTTKPALLHTGGLDIVVDGIVTPFRDIEVATEVAGKVKFKAEVCRAGNFVTKNTVLVEIDAQDYDLEVDRYEKQLKQTSAEIEEIGVEMNNVEALKAFAAQDLDLKKKEVERVFSSNVYSASERDQAQQSLVASQNAWQALENQLASLRAKQNRLEVASGVVAVQLSKARIDQARTTIRAPEDGVVVRDSVEAGSYVQKGTPLFVIEDTSSVEVRCNLQMDDLYWLWHQDAPEAGEGDPRRLAYQVPQTPAKVYYQMAGRKDLKYGWDGELRRYDGIGLDERTRTIPCRIVVEKPREVYVVGPQSESLATETVGPPALVRGMYVTVHVQAQPKAEFVKVPDSAIQPGKRTWRVRDRQLERIESLPLVRYVEELDQSGVSEGYWLVPSAESGISPGDRLVITPMVGMRHGMKVEVQDGAAAPEKVGMGS